MNSIGDQGVDRAYLEQLQRLTVIVYHGQRYIRCSRPENIWATLDQPSFEPQPYRHPLR